MFSDDFGRDVKVMTHVCRQATCWELINVTLMAAGKQNECHEWHITAGKDTN